MICILGQCDSYDGSSFRAKLHVDGPSASRSEGRLTFSCLHRELVLLMVLAGLLDCSDCYGSFSGITAGSYFQACLL